jgi:hypothetical protein
MQPPLPKLRPLQTLLLLLLLRKGPRPSPPLLPQRVPTLRGGPRPSTPEANALAEPSPSAGGLADVDHAAVVGMARVTVVQSANELKDLNEAAKVGLDIYLEAVTALEEAEMMRYEDANERH